MKPTIGTFSGFDSPLSNGAWSNATFGVNAAIESGTLFSNLNKINDAVQRSLPAIMQFSHLPSNAFRFEANNQKLFNAFNYMNDANPKLFNLSFWNEISSRSSAIHRALGGNIEGLEHMSAAIYRNTASLLSQFKVAEDLANKIPNFHSMSGLEFSLGKLSSEIAAASAVANNLDFLEEFQDASEEVMHIFQDINLEEVHNITSDDIAALYAKIDTVYSKLSKEISDGALLSKISNWVTIIGTLLTVWIFSYDHPNFLKSKTAINVPTVTSATAQKDETLFTNRKCRVYNQYSTNSLIQDSLKADYAVRVLCVNKKMAFVSYSSTKDGLLRTGWVMKKYITQK